MLLKFANKVRNFVWKTARAITIGVRVIAFQNHSFFLIQSSYKKGWYLPGGGLKRGETAEEAGRREAYEEGGILLGTLSLVGIFTDFSEGRSDHVIVFAGEVVGQEKTTSNEVKDSGFFSFEQIPPGISKGSLQRIEEFLEKQYPKCSTW